MAPKKGILITGGAGYLGSHLSLLLAQKNYDVIIVDHVPDNFPRSLAQEYSIVCYKGDCGNISFMTDIFTRHEIDTVIHTAAFIEVGASVTNPYVYYANNVAVTLSLLQAMYQTGIKRCIFSSSCAIFGYPKNLNLDEHAERAPLSPYGRTKYIVEQILEDAHHAYGLQVIIMRYFNIAGATPEYHLGERHIPETHIIPRLIAAASFNERIMVFGNDYPTHDGTCVRDYVHVLDLAEAHVCALSLLDKGYPYGSFNLGTGKGYSVRELIRTVEEVTNKKLIVVDKERRPGDPSHLVACQDHAARILGWRPVMSDLSTIIQTAHDFYIKYTRFL
jgi:UDP-glucose 4-epimerase